MNHPYPEQTRIEKINSEHGDAHPDGSRGRIVLVTGPLPDDAPVFGGMYGYFVEWDDMKGVPIGVIQSKLKPVY